MDCSAERDLRGAGAPASLSVLAGLLAEVGTGGNLTTDAPIAALALENRCPVVTFDRGIARFGVDCVISE